MKEDIILSVPKGTQIRSGNGSITTVLEVPDNALDLIEAGATWLMFKQTAKDSLKKLSEEKLNKLIAMRRSQKLTRDVAIIEMALAEKKSGKEKNPDSNEKSSK